MHTQDDIEGQTVLSSEKRDEPPGSDSRTDLSMNVLLRVVDDIPAKVWLAALVGTAERFVWYGAISPMRASAHTLLHGCILRY